jgi:hypothetical protein
MNGDESYKLKKKILYVVNKPLVVYRQKKRKKKITASLLELASHFDTNTMPLVRRSDSGGWHGIYSEVQSAIPVRGNSQDTNECNEIDSPSCSGSDSPRGVITEHFRGSVSAPAVTAVSNLFLATREVDVKELQTQTSDSSNEVSSTRLKCKGSKGDDSEPMYPPLDSINVPSNCTEVELQQEATDSFDPTIKRVELLYDESIRLQNALAKLSHMTGNLHRILNSRGVLAQDSMSNMSVDNRRQSVGSGSSHYLPLSLSQDILVTETPFETPMCTDFSVILARAIDKHREDALSPSGEQDIKSQDLANLNAIAEQDAVIQLEEELQQENKRLKMSLTNLSRAMFALHRAIVDSRREQKRNRTINEKLSVEPAMIEATISNDHTICNKKTSGNFSPKIIPLDCESVDDDELGLGFNDPLLSSPVKNKIKVDDVSKVGPEHCTNMITSTLKKKNKKKTKKRLIPIDNYTETLTNDNVDQKDNASIFELSDQKDDASIIEYKVTIATRAIIILQSIWRMMSQRKKYVSYKLNTVVFQSIWLMELENMASLLIQTNYRRHKTIKSHLRLSAAVIICQSVVRRYLALKHISRHLRNVKSATLLQSTWRRHLAEKQSAANSKDDCATAKTLDTMSVVVDTMLVVTINKHRDDILHLLTHSSHRDLIVQRRNSNLRALAAANQLVYRSGGQKLLPNDLKRLLAKAEEDAGRLYYQLKFRAAPALW